MTTTTIPTQTLNNGLEIPAFGLGAFQSPPEETTNAVETAIANGYTLVDAAAAYGNEREVGEGIRRAAIDRSSKGVRRLGPDNTLALRVIAR